MRRIFALSLVLVLFVISCQWVGDITASLSENPFIEEIDLKNGYDNEDYYKDGEYLRFILISDVHIGREDNDSDVVEREDELLSFLADKDYPFLICLGDLVDDGDFYDDRVKAFIESVLPYVNDNFIWVIGNHDKHKYSQEDWEEFVKTICPNESRMAHYIFDDISIYKLDNSSRVFGKKQLMYYEDALKRNDGKYRMNIVHENVTSGGVFDQSVVLFGEADIAERNRLYRIMNENDVSMIFSGHHHKGNIAYRIKSSLSEFNASAMHTRITSPIELESKGYWYEVEVDFSDSTLSVIAYYAETGERSGDEWTFGLKAH